MRTTSSEEQIFLQNEPYSCASDQEIQYQRSSEQNENEYLSQFLNSQGSDNLQQIISAKSEKVMSESVEICGQSQSFKIQNKQNLVKNTKRQKSCFHNFQKHLVITLRNVIKVKKSHKPGQIETIGFQMWNVFTKSTLYSKKFLHVLFGVYGNCQENEFSKNFLNELGFMEVFARYSEDSIKEAQTYLRKEIVKQLQKLNLKEYLTYRKLKRVDEFKTYIEEFLGEIRGGSVRKRLPKDRKILMINSIKQIPTSPSTTD